MTPHYFVFKGINSQAMGVQVESYPPIMRAPLRTKTITVPGRAGSLTLLEGDHIYDTYQRRMKIAVRMDGRLDEVLEWLSGHGSFVSGNEPDRTYQVTMQQAFTGEKLFRGVYHGELQMLTQPLKAMNPEPVITLTATRTVDNPGAVPSEPLIRCTGSGQRSIALGDVTISISSSAPATVLIDCAAGMAISESGASLESAVTLSEDEFPKLSTGQSTITLNGSFTRVEITPRWRWV